MNLQDLVKEIVAKTVAEKKLTAAEKKKKEDIVMAMKKDFKGPKAAMYAIATDKAKKLAEDDIEEVFKLDIDDEGNITRTPAKLTKQDPYEQGKAAWDAGVSYKNNPYSEGSEEAQAFYDGWMSKEAMSQAAHDKAQYEKEIGEGEEISDEEMAQLQSTADDTSKMPADRDAARNKIYAARAEKELSENKEKYYAIFDLNSDPIYYASANSAQEMLSLLNGYLKSKSATQPGYNFSYDMEDLSDDVYNGKVLPHTISDDFALVTKNPLIFQKDLNIFPKTTEYKGQSTQELDEVTKRKMQYYAGIIK